ncbi:MULTISPECIES: lytic transglycosylase domain-containing protein [unclassified Variovorax]|uniref:lytic transglycosylase domain-containing protein n=1 Tax=unclassified Variovorax TaxID=663243 RepID=UPI001BD38F72|nr:MULTISPECIES: lytic transglycosylase domain-containing protein [unclassified Variovorax]
MNLSPTLRRLAQASALLCAAWLAGCGSTGTVPGQLSNATPGRDKAATAPPRPSNAGTARDYRRDAARHIYEINAQRIYEGKLPPMLYAIGTLEVNVDAGGKVVSMHWMRAPQHAPEVIAEIERTVLAASPFPVATKLGKVTYTDTWLWDKGGRFQLDTLSEGQL